MLERLAKLFSHRINEPDPSDPNEIYWQKVEKAREALAADVALRKQLIGRTYAKRRAAALKATRNG